MFRNKTIVVKEGCQSMPLDLSIVGVFREALRRPYKRLVWLIKGFRKRLLRRAIIGSSAVPPEEKVYTIFVAKAGPLRFRASLA